MQRRYIVVGSGVAGGLLCQGLLKDADNHVTLVEAGPPIRMRDYGKWIEHVTTGTTPYDAFLDSDSDYENHGPQDLVLRNSRVMARGGSTLHWDGCCPRLAPEDFVKKSRCGFGEDWPFGYEDLESYYEMAEVAIGVSADPLRSHVPRARPLPFPPFPINAIDRIFSEGCDKLGWSSEQIPIARNVFPIHGRPACQTTGTCRYCPVGGRFTGDQLTESLGSHPRVSLVRGVVMRAMPRGRHAVAGVEILDPATGLKSLIEGDRVILCGGAIESTKLLLASSSPLWPRGIGNGSGHLGRHLVAHPLLKLRIGIPFNPARLRRELYFPAWCSRELDSPETQKAGKLIIFPFGGPGVDIAQLISEGKSIESVNDAVSGPAELLLAALMEMREGEGSRIELGSGTTRFGFPRTKIHFEWESESLRTAGAYRETLDRVARAMGWQPLGFQIDQSSGGRVAVRADHVTGTCRMAKDEATGVVDANLRVHGIDNLWVCSNAVFPSPGVANPTLTLSALALRLAAHLA
jgi:choline dehydrogenase-like flavoprotein